MTLGLSLSKDSRIALVYNPVVSTFAVCLRDERGPLEGGVTVDEDSNEVIF